MIAGKNWNVWADNSRYVAEEVDTNMVGVRTAKGIVRIILLFTQVTTTPGGWAIKVVIKPMRAKVREFKSHFG